MAKYHINKNGVPALCRAVVRPCPLGGDEVHFDSIEDAQAYAEKKNEELFGLLVDVANSSEDVGIQSLQFDELQSTIDKNANSVSKVLDDVRLTRILTNQKGKRVKERNLIPEAKISQAIIDDLEKVKNDESLSEVEKRGRYLDGINQLSKQAALMKNREEYDLSYPRYQKQVEVYLDSLENSLEVVPGADYSIQGAYSNINTDDIDEYGIPHDLNFENKADEKRYLLNRNEHMLRSRMYVNYQRMTLGLQKEGRLSEVKYAKELHKVNRNLEEAVAKSTYFNNEQEYNKNKEWGKPATGMSYDEFTHANISKIEESLDEIDMITSSDLFPAEYRNEFEEYTSEVRGRLRLEDIDANLQKRA